MLSYLRFSWDASPFSGTCQAQKCRRVAEKNSLEKRKRSSLHLFKGKAQRGWNGMRPTSEVITPHQGRLASCEDTLMLTYVTYLMFHVEAGASHSDNTNSDLYGIRTHQWQHVRTGHFFDEYAIMTPIRACLNTWIVRWVRDDAFCLLMLLARRPFLQPGFQMIEIVTSRFLEIGKVDGIIHMCQGVKIAKANLH